MTVHGPFSLLLSFVVLVLALRWDPRPERTNDEERAVEALSAELRELQHRIADTRSRIVTVTSRRAGVVDESSTRVTRILRSVDELAEIVAHRPRLVVSWAEPSAAKTIENLVFSWRWFTREILDRSNEPLRRAKAFLALATLPNAEALFSRQLREEWRWQVVSVDDPEALAYLADVYRRIEPTGDSQQVKSLYMDLLLRGPTGAIRASAVEGLRHFLADRDVVELLEFASRQDPDPLVRGRAQGRLSRRGDR